MREHEFGRREMGHTGSSTLTTKTSRTTDEDGHLIFKKELSRSLVPRVDKGGDGSGLALVQHLKQPGVPCD